VNGNAEIDGRGKRVKKHWTRESTTRQGAITSQCNRLRLLDTCSITNKQNNNVIDKDYDYIESNHDYNRDYICLETFSERKQNPFAWFDVSMFLDNIRYE